MELDDHGHDDVGRDIIGQNVEFNILYKMENWGLRMSWSSRQTLLR